MKLTGNYNLKKPDGSDVVNIQDINDTVEKIDEELKKINVKADDMSFTTATDRVNIESGDSRKMVLGKISKWFRDLKGLAFKDKVAVGDLDSSLIAHNLTTTDVGKVLGADQGGVLKKSIGELNDNLDEVGSRFQTGGLHKFGITDFNKCTVSGIYRFEAHELNRPDNVSYSQLLVMHSPTTDTITQIVVSFNNSRMYVRSGNPPDVNGSGVWSDWNKIATSNDLESNTKLMRLVGVGFSDGYIYATYPFPKKYERNPTVTINECWVDGFMNQSDGTCVLADVNIYYAYFKIKKENINAIAGNSYLVVVRFDISD